MRGQSCARYSFGGDDHIFVEVETEMSLTANLRVMAITSSIQRQEMPGVLDVCPANASYLVRFDPLVLAPAELLGELKQIEQLVGPGLGLELETSIVEIPVLYGDPWTHETMMRFRPHHQDPESTDLEYVTRVNGFQCVEDFIVAHSGSPWFTSMVGFVAGLPFLYQMVPRARQLQAAKYSRPRTDTPRQTVGHGGCFTAIYSVRGAGGYQMLGITPAPIYDPDRVHADFSDDVVFFEPGRLAKFESIDRDTYDALADEVADGRFRFKQRPLQFSLAEFLADPEAYNADLLRLLDDG